MTSGAPSSIPLRLPRRGDVAFAQAIEPHRVVVQREKSRGEVGVRSRSVLGDQTEKDGPHEIIVSIKDADIGIAPEMQPHLFDMFFQGDSSKERRYGGLGIGLTLARRIVELHDGRIEVSSDGLGQRQRIYRAAPLTKASGALNKYLADAGKTTNPHSTLWSK